MDINTHLDNIKIFDLKKPNWYNEFLKIKMNENDILRDIYPEDVSLDKKKQPLFLETYYLIKSSDIGNDIDNILLWDNYNKLYISPINLKSDKNVVICCTQWNLKTDYIYELNKLLTNIPGFILVTTHGDSTLLETYSRSKLGGQKKNNDKNNNIIDKNIFEKTKMKHWFGHNNMADHPKISSIPIGVCGWSKQYGSIYHFRDKYIDTIEKKYLLLINFGALGHYGTIRKDIQQNKDLWNFSLFMGGKKYNSVYNRAKFKNRDYIYSWYKLLSSFYFIFSPPGTGWDCYRTWEAIYLGVIPILLKTDTPFDNMYDDLPVIFVDNYEMVTEKYLLNEWEQMSTKTFNFEKIKIKYWSNLIENKL